MSVAVCVKWVDLRPEVDPLTGVVRHDARTTGLSDADQAAIEWALRAGEAWGEPVVAVTAGPDAADAALRDAPHLVMSELAQQRLPAIACGVAERMFRVDNPMPKPGLRRIVRQEARRAGVRLRDLAKDGWTAVRGFG